MKVIAAPGCSSANDNPYIDLLYTPMRSSGVTVDDWNRRRVALGRYDVVHVHWPEFLIRYSTPSTTALDVAKVLAVIWWARQRGAVLIWTGHDLEPHDEKASRTVRIFQKLFFRQVDGLIAMDPSSVTTLRRRWPSLERVPAAVVPHGHYRTSHPPLIEPRAAVRERLGLPVVGPIYLAFGQIRRYKNLVALVHSFVANRFADETLLVAGRCSDDALRHELEEAASDGVVLKLDGIPHETVSALFRGADVAVQCYHERSALNSGVQLLALSCELPVVTASAPSTHTISRTVGPGWITQTDHDPAMVLLAARQVAARGRPQREPDLAHLEWDRLAAQTVDLYEDAISKRGRRSGTGKRT